MGSAVSASSRAKSLRASGCVDLEDEVESEGLGTVVGKRAGPAGVPETR